LLKNALFRSAFATVLRALSDDFSQTSNILPKEYVDNWLQKILHTTQLIQQDKSFGILIKYANTAVSILLETIKQFDEHLQNDIFQFVIQQIELTKQNWPYEADANLLKLIIKITDLTDRDSCARLASSIFAANSRIWSYRFFYSNSVGHFIDIFLFFEFSVFVD